MNTNPPKKPYQLFYTVTHPIQYQAPWLKMIANHPDIDILVVFYWDKKTEPQFDEKFQRKIEWDVPLLEGYRYIFLSDHAKRKTKLSKLIALWKLMRKEEFNLVWAHGYTDFYMIFTLLFAKLKRFKTLTRGDSILFPRRDNNLTKKKWIFSVLNYFVDCYLAVGTENKKYYQACGVPDQKIGSCNYAVDNDYFKAKIKIAKENVSTIKSELQLIDHRPIILYVGKFSTEKRPMDLLDAYLKLAENASVKPYLIFVGAGEFEKVLKIKAQTHADTIRFTGFKNQSEVPAFYALADILVLPSIHEKWGLVVNESMNAGCAMIVTDCVGSRSDLVHHGDNGFIYPAQDTDALADYLKQLIENPNELQRMKQKSLDIIAHWGLKESVDGVRAACSQLMLEK